MLFSHFLASKHYSLTFSNHYLLNLLILLVPGKICLTNSCNVPWFSPTFQPSIAQLQVNCQGNMKPPTKNDDFCGAK